MCRNGIWFLVIAVVIASGGISIAAEGQLGLYNGPRSFEGTGSSSEATVRSEKLVAVPAATLVEENGLQCDVVTFEGLGDNVPIGRVAGSVDIIFGSSWLSLIDQDAGGGGNFANEPSPSTAAYFLDQDDISIRLSAGVQVVEFQYSAAAQSLPVHVIAYDENDNLVDDNRSAVVGTDYDGAACGGDPNGNFCQWTPLTLSSTSANIRRIEILGTVSNYFGIDNLKFCLGECVPTAGQEAVRESIFDFGTCPPVGAKIPVWGGFGRQQVLQSDSGEQLEVECAGQGLAAFFLYYTPPGGSRMKVGMCPFVSGCNTPSFYHSGDNDQNGKPDCFIRTRWISRDYGDNDKPNGWTGELDWPLENLIPPYVDLLDWAESVYEINTDSLTKIDRKYEYVNGPPVNGCGAVSPAPEGDLFEKQPVTSTAIDPPLGPETEAFFDNVLRTLQDVPPDENPMGEDQMAPCDFDRNGQCDSGDRAKLHEHIGSCDGEPGYNPLADADGNGCLTLSDEIDLFGPEKALRGDVDGDGDVDRLDLREISRSRNQPADGPNDPRDVNGDGLITVEDVTAAIPLCTLPGCAIQ